MKTQKSFKNVAFAFVFLFSIVSTALLAQDPKPTATPSETKADEMTPGLIVLTGFEGDVKIASAKNPVGITPAAGAKLQMGDIILTGTDGTASLAFSNGSVLQVQISSKFSIEEYLQKPWDFDEAAFKKLEKEPTASKTKLKLDYGEVICNVKKLSATSEMSVSTPLGVAGIRGTKFKLSVTLDSKGKPAGSKLSVVEGAVALSSQGSGQAPLLVTSGLASSISVNPAADGTFEVVFDAPLTKKDIEEITVIIDEIIKQISEFVMSAIVAQEETKKQEEAKKSEQGDQKPQDGEKKEGDENQIRIDRDELPPPDTGAEGASEQAAAVATAAKAKAEAEANTLSGFALSSTSINFGDVAPTITAPTSVSTGAITYTSSNESVARVSGTTITIVGAGTTKIKANQAAKGLFPAPPEVTASLTVGKGTPTLTNFALSSTSINFGDAAPTITVPTSVSTGAITYTSSNMSVATVSGSTITVVGPGSATITASQVADANYNAPAQVTASLTVVNNTGTVTTVLKDFNLDNHKVSGNGTTRTVRIVAPTSNQPLAPSSIVYSLDPSTAGSFGGIGGTTLTLTAPCRIYATQAPAPGYTGGNASIGLNWTLTTDSEVISRP